MKTILLIVRRFAAFFVDWLIFAICSFPFAVFYWLGGANEMIAGRTDTILVWTWLVYYAGFEWIYGATIGKFVFGLTARQADGVRLSLMKSVSRIGLIFIIPFALADFVYPVTLFFNKSGFAQDMSGVVSVAIIAIVPLSIVIFKGQSLADLLIGTCVAPVKTSEAIGPTATSGRWALLGVLSLVLGIGLILMLNYATRLIFGSGDINEQLHAVVNALPPDLLPQFETSPGEKQTMLDFRGRFIRQRGERNLSYLDVGLLGTASSYDELMMLRHVAYNMAALPDAERPRCENVKFYKDFEAVLASFVYQHEMSVCDVPQGLPYLATIVDHQQTVSLNWKIDPTYMLRALIGESGYPVRKVGPTASQQGQPLPTRR